jgi:hypothetical protein
VQHHCFVGKPPQLPQATYNNTRSNTHAASIVTAAVPGIDIHLEMGNVAFSSFLILSLSVLMESNDVGSYPSCSCRESEVMNKRCRRKGVIPSPLSSHSIFLLIVMGFLILDGGQISAYQSYKTRSLTHLKTILVYFSLVYIPRLNSLTTLIRFHRFCHCLSTLCSIFHAVR